MTYPHEFAPSVAEAIDQGIDFSALRGSIEEGIETLLRHPRFDVTRRLLFTGSGDSLFAPVSAVPALRRWSGSAATALSSMEFARYELPLLTGAEVVIGVSNSGSASRTRECVTLARANGNLTVGLTGSREGPLASLAEIVVHRPVRDLAGVDPTVRRVFLNMVEYLATLYALYLLGIRLGTHAGRLDHAQAASLVQAVEDTIRSLPETARDQEAIARSLARTLEGADTVWVIGAGPNYGTARYAAAKFHEQLPVNGIPEDLEEWAHLQYFLTLTWQQRSVVCVLAPPGNAADRARELVEGIANAGGRAIVVCGKGDADVPQASVRFDVGPVNHEWLTPLVYHLPLQLLVLHLAAQKRVPLTPLARQDAYWLIRKGTVRTRAEGLK